MILQKRWVRQPGQPCFTSRQNYGVSLNSIKLLRFVKGTIWASINNDDQLTSCFRDAPDFPFAVGLDFECGQQHPPRILPFTKQMCCDKMTADNLQSSIHLMSIDIGLRCEGGLYYRRPLHAKQRRKLSSAELLFGLKSLWWAPVLSSYITKWWHNIWGQWGRSWTYLYLQP